MASSNLDHLVTPFPMDPIVDDKGQAKARITVADQLRERLTPTALLETWPEVVPDEYALLQQLTDPSRACIVFERKRLIERAEAFLKAFCAPNAPRQGDVAYAVKTNPSQCVLKCLADHKFNLFDVATETEALAVFNAAPGAKLIATHTTMPECEMYALHHEYGVNIFVVDEMDHLAALTRTVRDRASVTCVVRLSTTSKAIYNLSEKFAAVESVAINLLKHAAAAGFQTGIAFHVGSQSCDPSAYEAELERAAKIVCRSGVSIRLVDVGGGFPIQYQGDPVPPLSEYFNAINLGLDKREFEGATVICEPGRGLVGDCMSLFAAIRAFREGVVHIGDGRWGVLSEDSTGGIRWPVTAWLQGSERQTNLVELVQIVGATCDSEDHQERQYAVPSDLSRGDWLEFRNVGAYGICLTTNFNYIRQPKLIELKRRTSEFEAPLPALTIKRFERSH